MKNPIIPGIIIVQLLLLGIIVSMGAQSRQNAQAEGRSDICQRTSTALPSPPPMMDRDSRDKAIADELGVTTEAFQQAMEQLPDEQRGTQPSPEMRTLKHEAMAKALNVDVTKIDEVLHKYRPRFMPPPRGQDQDHGRPVEAVAKELGVTPEQFREAFKLVTPAKRGTEPTDAQRKHNREVLSQALGVSPEKLDQVMDKYRPEGPNKRPPSAEPTDAPSDNQQPARD